MELTLHLSNSVSDWSIFEPIIERRFEATKSDFRSARKLLKLRKGDFTLIGGIFCQHFSTAFSGIRQ